MIAASVFQAGRDALQCGVIASAGRARSLYAHVDAAWPGAKMRREVLATAWIGDQLISGRLDLPLTDEEGAIVLDYKSFPASRDAWEMQVIGYGA